MKLPAEIKQKWLDALRSGEYEQAQNVLFDGKNGYCCLGILEKCVAGDVSRRLDGAPDTMPSTDFWVGLLKPDLSKKHFSTPHEAYVLAEMNDGAVGWEDDDELEQPHSFNEIADWIELKVGVV